MVLAESLDGQGPERVQEQEIEGKPASGAVFGYHPMARPDIPGLYVSPDDAIPELSARSAVVMDAATRRVLYERDMKTRRFPASTTKIMTLIIALENSSPDEIVYIGPHAAGAEGSTLWLQEGDEIPMGELLTGMMMRSGNDATIAVAEHIAGSVDAFAKLMTEKAKEIGAEDTSFVNSSGLPDENHYTTAYDLALIASYGYREVPHFEEIVSTKEIEYPWVKDETKHLRNENQMLWLYRGGNGVKTGYTEAAGRCLVSGAKQNGLQLVSVVLDSTYMWNDSIALLDYGFQHVKAHTLCKAGDTVASIPVRKGRGGSVPAVAASDVTVPLQDGEKEKDYEKHIEVPKNLQAPVKAGDVVGKLVLTYKGKPCYSTDLIASRDVEEKSLFRTVWQALQDIGKGWL